MNDGGQRIAAQRLRVSVLLACIAGVGLLLRIRVLMSPSGAMNADEATMGVMALDIRHGSFPVVLAGQAYTAVIESYPAAILISLFGPHATMLKFVSIGFWAIGTMFLIGAARQIVDPALAWLGGALFWMTPGALVLVSTQAYPGYGIGIASMCASLWATGRVLTRESPDWRSSAAAGAMAGLAFYIHPMFLSVVLPHIGYAAWRHRRQLRAWWAPTIAAAVTINIPFIVWTAIEGVGSFDDDTAQPGTYFGRLRLFFTGLMPRALGLMRPDGSWLFGRAASVGVGLMLVGLGVLGLRRLVRGEPAHRAIAVATVLVWPLMAVFSAHGYVRDGRYGIIPFAPLVLCFAAGTVSLIELAAAAPTRSRLRTGLGIGAGALWCGLLAVPYVTKVIGPRVDDPNPTTTALVARLNDAGISRVTGSYWLVQPVALWTQGRIVAKPTSPQPIRSQRMADIVDGSPADTVAHVFFADQDWTWTLNMPIDNYLREEVGGVIVYLPIDQE